MAEDFVIRNGQLQKYKGNESSVVIPDSVTSIGEEAFDGCSSLTSITIPDSVTSIGWRAFYGCSSLTSIIIPDSVTSIGWRAFYGCSSLTSIKIPDNVTSIGKEAFEDCSSLTSITIPASVTSIGWRAFSGCSSLKTAGPIGSGSDYEFGWTTSIPENVFSGCSNLTSIMIPKGVTSIGEYAFMGCSSLTSITIPEDVTSIGEYAFYGCSSLTSITIPEDVTSIGEYAFMGCSSLTSITIPDNVTSIGERAFRGCSSLTSITIPDSVTSIGEWAFMGCSCLTSITIPDSVTSIGERAFYGCSSLKTAGLIGSGSDYEFGWTTSIPANAFSGCSGLTSITIPDNVTSIGERAFYGCSSLKTAGPIGSGSDYEFGWTTSIPAHAFSGCSGLTSITIPDSVTSIGYRAFEDCSSLTSITIPDSVTSIGEWAFYGCSSLTSISIPDNVTSIGEYAFSGCSSLTSISIPDNVTSIGYRAFSGCSSLTSITIPDNVTSIGWDAFSGCSSLTSITIPDSVTSIGEYAFYGCSSLTNITIPDNVASIGERAFRGCSSLKSVSIPTSVTSIGKEAFYGCSSLKVIEIPEGIIEIGSSAFEGCTSLKVVRFPSTLKKVGKEAFQYCDHLKHVEVTNNSLSYGQDCFPGDASFKYTPEMFRTTGKLNTDFLNNMDVCGIEELGWILMYQKGDVWDAEISKRITKDNADSILKAMTEHIAGLGKAGGKPAGNAVKYITANIILLSKESIQQFCDTLREIKKNKLCDDLLSDSAVSAKFSGGSESAAETDIQVRPDGSIWLGKVEEPFEAGSCFRMGNDAVLWRILEIDNAQQTMLVIADETICNRPYHEKKKAVTWEGCTLRKLLNEDYLNEEFTEQERAAIVSSHLPNPDNPEYGTKGGNDTDDMVFLLSIDEAEKYFKNDTDRSTGSGWRLRSPGSDTSRAAAIEYNGQVNHDGYTVRWDYLYGSSVRPAFRLDLQSEIMKSIITKNQKNQPIITETPLLVIKNGTVIYASRHAETVDLPSYIKKIAEGAFRNCENLKEIKWTGKMPVIETGSFYYCPNLKLPAEFYLRNILPADEFAKCIPSDPAVMAHILLTAQRNSIYCDSVIEGLDPSIADQVADELLRQAPGKKVIKDPELVLRFMLAAAPALGSERLKSFTALLNKIDLPNQKWKSIVKREAERTDECEPVIGKYLFKVPYELLSTDMKELDQLPRLAKIVSVTGEYAGQYGNGCVEPREYRKGASEYSKSIKADDSAREMNHEALMSLLRSWIKVDKRWYASYAAFANDKELEELLAEMKTWEKDKSRREQIIRVRGAVLLNDTVTAMRYADKMGLLGRYAEMRSVDEDEIRDNIISDFGLDSDGRHTWILAGKTLTAKVNRDLTVSLFDDTGKTLKSVPKKGADPEEYNTVKAEYDAIRKGIKPTAKTRNDRIFNDFLSGRKRDAKQWESAYLKNPVLRILASLIVWEQDGQTFTLNENGETVTVTGDGYVLTDSPISVAHPMEMSAEETESWQRYFNDNDLKQPFEQVWEPIADKDSIRPGRYDNCTIPLHMLMNKEKHGIIMEGQSMITLKGCSAGLKLIEGHKDWYNNEFEIKDFKYDVWDRQVNHIVVHLDKGTVAGRVKKDDITAAQWFDRFTLAQIMEFIDIANEAQAHNVLAQLMEYKDTHYGDYDPMDEFTLDF